MPYITQDSRDRLAAGATAENAGELNYTLTRLVDDYLVRKSAGDGRLRYAHLNEVIGVIECAKLELYRRVVAPYEEEKRNEAGEVYQAGTP